MKWFKEQQPSPKIQAPLEEPDPVIRYILQKEWEQRVPEEYVNFAKTIPPDQLNVYLDDAARILKKLAPGAVLSTDAYEKGEWPPNVQKLFELRILATLANYAFATNDAILPSIKESMLRAYAPGKTKLPQIDGV